MPYDAPIDDSQVVVALAQVLDAGTSFVWSVAGGYAANQIGIYYGAIPADPDQAVGLTLYDTDDDIQTQLAQRRVQLFFRGARGGRASADDMASEAFAALQRYVGNGLAHVSRVSSARLGADINDRQERTDNYTIVLENA